MAYAAALGLGGAASWAVARFAPNLANLVRKLWQTRKIKMPSYKGLSNVKATTQVGFTKKGVPYQQSYNWTSQVGGLKYQAPLLKRGPAKFLPKGTEVSSSIVGKKLKAAGKLSIVGATGTALGFAAKERRDSTGPASVRTRQFKAVIPKSVAPMKVNTGETTTVKKTKGPDRFSSGSYQAPSKQGLKTRVMTRPSIASYKAAPKAKVPVVKVAKTTKVITTKTKTKAAPKKVSKTIPIATTAASRKATAMGKAAATAIRRFGVTPAQITAADISEKKRLLAYRGGKIAGPKKITGFKSPFAGDIARKQASGYHIFKGGSKGALSFRKAHAAAKGKKFKWIGTGKWYSGA
jgi:hypothetical protein